jgi:hypothetical protein
VDAYTDRRIAWALINDASSNLYNGEDENAPAQAHAQLVLSARILAHAETLA